MDVKRKKDKLLSILRDKSFINLLTILWIRRGGGRGEGVYYYFVFDTIKKGSIFVLSLNLKTRL